MEFSPFIGIDFSVLSGNRKKPDLSYWISGKYITDAQGNQKYTITNVGVISGQRTPIVVEL